MMAGMTKRLTLSLREDTAEYLAIRAGERTGGNVSALVDQLVQRVRLGEAVEAELAWEARHPDAAADAELERYAA
jgi:hypothetical protein